MKAKTERKMFGVYLENEQRMWLEKFAEAEDRSINYMVRKAIANFIEEQKDKYAVFSLTEGVTNQRPVAVDYNTPVKEKQRKEN